MKYITFLYYIHLTRSRTLVTAFTTVFCLSFIQLFFLRNNSQDCNQCLSDCCNEKDVLVDIQFHSRQSCIISIIGIYSFKCTVNIFPVFFFWIIRSKELPKFLKCVFRKKARKGEKFINYTRKGVRRRKKIKILHNLKIGKILSVEHSPQSPIQQYSKHMPQNRECNIIHVFIHICICSYIHNTHKCLKRCLYHKMIWGTRSKSERKRENLYETRFVLIFFGGILYFGFFFFIKKHKNHLPSQCRRDTKPFIITWICHH